MGAIAQQLAQQKDALVKNWFDRVINTYPAETARFLRSQKDPFANPVGQTTRRHLSMLLALLGSRIDPDAARQALDPIIRIRAIQDFTASQATGFVFELKRVIRETLAVAPEAREELSLIDSRIDQLALLAFDIFMQCREKIYELKANELKERTYKAFAKAGLIKEPGDE